MSKAESRTPISKPRGERADALDHFPKKPRSILEAAAVAALTRVCAEKFVSQVPMAVFDVNKIKA